MKTINVNGVEFIEKSYYDSLIEERKAEMLDDMEYCIVRTYSAGVFAGYVEKREGKEVTLRKARRIWYWDGANSLSQLAVDGTLKPENCKFAVEVNKILVLEAIEIIPCTEKARLSITEVEEWKIKN